MIAFGLLLLSSLALASKDAYALVPLPHAVIPLENKPHVVSAARWANESTEQWRREEALSIQQVRRPLASEFAHPFVASTMHAFTFPPKCREHYSLAASRLRTSGGEAVALAAPARRPLQLLQPRRCTKASAPTMRIFMSGRHRSGYSALFGTTLQSQPLF